MLLIEEIRKDIANIWCDIYEVEGENPILSKLLQKFMNDLKKVEKKLDQYILDLPKE